MKDKISDGFREVPDDDEEVDTPSRVTIRIAKGEIARMTDEAEDALIRAADIAPIMVRAGMLVQPIVDRLPASHDRMTEVTLLRPLSPANIIYLLNKHAAVFERYDERSRRWLAVDPPTTVAMQLLEKGKWRFPKVVGIISTPTLRSNDTILDRPGYDPATQLWYSQDSEFKMPPLIENPTREQAEEALKLLEGLLVNFPFVVELDCAVVLSAMLTGVLRGAFTVVPMNLYRAHDVSNGKSYLADVISTIVHGQPCPVITFVKSIEEMEKRLGALVLEGAPMIALDNCSEDIGGNLLCQITERRVIRIRILGKSENPKCEWRGMLFANGNNVTIAGDLTRRTLIANLDAGVERAELREFSFDPVERILANRGAYVAAPITIARAYIAAGSPKVCGPLASYEKWSKLVRSPLIWLGREDPVKSLDQARKEDPVRRVFDSLIDIWRERLMHDVGYTATELINHAVELTADRLPTTELHELLLQQAGTPRGDIDARRLGNWLMSICGRIHNGHRIERVKEDNKHGNRYALVQHSKKNDGC
jgi:putative DNA primase/helicase